MGKCHRFQPIAKKHEIFLFFHWFIQKSVRFCIIPYEYDCETHGGVALKSCAEKI
jgi:hypothetical protein